MADRATIVLDVGKTLSKLSIWTREGQFLERRTRPNPRLTADGRAVLDAQGIESWIESTLRDFAQLADVGAIIPVSHGAAAAVIRDGQLVQAPLDYEADLPATIRQAYHELRDPFARTGSPALPLGLNLGAQLYYQQSLDPDWLQPGSVVLPWAQYWSWLLSGVATCELTSLGCHSDLWNPLTSSPSTLALSRGWAQHLAALRPAADILGSLLPHWVERTGLPPDTRIYCGLHDSNAALHAARVFPEIADRAATILSTGTWFVAMRLLRASDPFDLQSLPDARDCLVNVDVFGRMVPSARFMGGREIESLTGLDTRRLDLAHDQAALCAAVSAVLSRGAMVLPTLVPGTGPFPAHLGRWISMPEDGFQLRAAVALYAALMADVLLDLIGAQERILIEGRFAESDIFVRALASLRRESLVFVGHAHTDVAFGALRLVHPTLAAPGPLRRVEPLPEDLHAYRALWHERVART